MRERQRLLIVGAFKPNASKGIGGGIATSCLKLLDSKMVSDYDVLTLDTTIKSNPPPAIPMKLYWSGIRFLGFLRIMCVNKPQKILLFTADGLSFLEKTVMGRLAQSLGVQSFVFLRANRLLVQLERSSLFRWLAGTVKHEHSVFLYQGESVRTKVDRYLSHDPERSCVVPNWTADVDQLPGSHVKAGCENNFEVIFVGWVASEKGVFTLLDAFARLSRRHPNFRLKVVGAGSHLDVFRNEVRAMGLDCVISVPGWLERAEVKKLLNASSVFVLPSKSEGMPNSVIEAMSVGLPVVTSPVGVLPDYFTHDENIIFVDPGDARALELAVEGLYLDQSKRLAIADKGLNVVRRTFEPEYAVQKLIDVLNGF